MVLSRHLLVAAISLALADAAQAQSCSVGESGPAGEEPCTSCTKGTYQDQVGQSTCISADLGFFVQSTGASSQTQCNPGTFQNVEGQSARNDANPGFFVDGVGASAATACPAGSLSYDASTACRSAPSTGMNIVSPSFDSEVGRGGKTSFKHAIKALESNPHTLNVSNASSDMGMAGPLTRLTLNTVNGMSSADGQIMVSGFTPGTSLEEGETLNLNLQLVPSHLGWVNLQLNVSTDETADLGANGLEFQFDFAAGADGEDIAVKLRADRPDVAINDSFTVWLDASNPGNSVANSNILSVQEPAGLDCSWQGQAYGGSSGNTNNLGNAQPETLFLPARSRVLYEGTCIADQTISNPIVISTSIQPDPGINNVVNGNNSDSTDISVGTTSNSSISSSTAKGSAASVGTAGIKLSLLSKTNFLQPNSMQKIIYELHNEGPDPIIDGNFALLLFGAAEYLEGSSTPLGTNVVLDTLADEGVPRQLSPLAQTIDFSFDLPVGQSIQYTLFVRAENLEPQRLQVIATATLAPGWDQQNSAGSILEFTTRGGLFIDSFED